mgnify:CR=1 FL=1
MNKRATTTKAMMLFIIVILGFAMVVAIAFQSNKIEDERYIRGCRNTVSDQTFGAPLGTCPKLEQDEDGLFKVSFISNAEKPIAITEARAFIINATTRGTCTTKIEVDSLPKKPSEKNPALWQPYEYASFIFDCQNIPGGRIEVTSSYYTLPTSDPVELTGVFYQE